MATNNSINNNGLSLIQTQTVSSVTALAFTQGITTNYNNYLFISSNFNNPPGTGVQLLLQISIDGGATYINTNYSPNAISASTASFVASTLVLPSSTMFANSKCYLLNMTSAVGYPTTIVSTSNFDSINGYILVTNNLSNAYSITPTVANALQIIMDDGSAFSGSFSLYGYSQ